MQGRLFPLQKFKKLIKQSHHVTATISNQLNKSTLPYTLSIRSSQLPHLYVYDRLSKKFFLVDSGSSLNLLPASLKSNCPTGQLLAANGSPVFTFGKLSKHIEIGIGRFLVSFTLASVDIPILGNSFLQQHGLLVDMAGGQLLHRDCLFRAAALKEGPSPTIGLISSDAIETLLSKFSGVIKADLSNQMPEHSVEHVIETTDPLLFSHP